MSISAHHSLMPAWSALCPPCLKMFAPGPGHLQQHCPCHPVSAAPPISRQNIFPGHAPDRCSHAHASEYCRHGLGLAALTPHVTAPCQGATRHDASALPRKMTAPPFWEGPPCGLPGSVPAWARSCDLSPLIALHLRRQYPDSPVSTLRAFHSCAGIACHPHVELPNSIQKKQHRI